MEINIYNSRSFGTRNAGIVIAVYPPNQRYAATVIENVVPPEGVDTPEDEWYVLNTTPQWIVDLITETLRPIVDAYTNRQNRI